MAPPRHTKSELASRRFPAWYLGRNPDRQVIFSTYAQDFADDFGRDVRGIVSGDEYGRLFETAVRDDSRAANRWHTTTGGVYVAVGAGGPITGRGAHLAIIDDPVKNRDDADSETIRNRIWKWYTSTLRTRLMPGGAIVLILTRWHEDDLAGRLLEQMRHGGEDWEVLSLPAIDEDGHALWPDWFPLDELEAVKASIGIRDWSALYQQNPTSDEGGYFKRSWFKRFDIKDRPKVTSRYIATDFAVSDGRGDFTELGLFEVDESDDLWVMDWWHGQTTPDEWIDRLLDMVAAAKPLAVFGETGVIRKSVEPFLNKRSGERKVYARYEWITRTGDKAAMARSFQARASMGKVHIPYTDFGDRLIEQLCAFPSGKHDDAVDACALMGMALDTLVAGIARKEQIAPVDAWGRKTRRNENWKTL